MRTLRRVQRFACGTHVSNASSTNGAGARFKLTRMWAFAHARHRLAAHVMQAAAATAATRTKGCRRAPEPIAACRLIELQQSLRSLVKIAALACWRGLCSTPAPLPWQSSAPAGQTPHSVIVDTVLLFCAIIACVPPLTHTHDNTSVFYFCRLRLAVTLA